MLPIGTVGKTRYRGYVTFTLLLVNLVAFAVQLSVQASGEGAMLAFFERYALSVCYIGEQPLGITLRNGLFSLFLHGGLLHIVMNMVTLWVFGPKVESYFGHRNFLLFYILTGFVAHLAHAVFAGVTCNPALPGAGGFIIGASGAIAGVLGAFLLLFPATRVRTLLFIPLPRNLIIPYRIIFVSAKMYLLLWLAMGVVELILPFSSNVAHWAHIGGFGAGFALVFVATLFKPAPKVDPFEYLDAR